MLETLRNALKVEDIRKRMFFTFLMLVVIRFGSQLPTPGVNADFIANFFANQASDAFNFFNAFTGGSFAEMSVFALSISPYITSSIIMQLLTIAIPKLEEMQKEGEEGRKKIAAITRYVTVALALIQSTAMAIGFGNQLLLDNDGFVGRAIVVCTLTAGSAFLMWVGERITEKGIGNGISIVLVINILASVPADLVRLFVQFVRVRGEGEVIGASNIGFSILGSVVILAVILAVVVFVVLLQGGERRIAVQYSQKIQGRKSLGGQSTHIPMKVNTAGVIPIIFASSLMQFPQVIAQLIGRGQGTGFWSHVLQGMDQNTWFNFVNFNPLYSIGLLFYIGITIFFAYFYTSITFNPMEIANNMKKNGGFIPGIRPGKPSVEYLQRILNYVIFIGAVGLVIVQVVPFFFNGMFNARVSFGGTSLIIIVGVVLETIKQVESKMLVRNYSGFLNVK